MLAERILRTTRSIADGALRAAHVRTVLVCEDLEEVARALDTLATKAELGDPDGREVLVAIVDALSDPSVADVVQLLREQAAGSSLLPLDRLLRRPVKASRGLSDRPPRPPDYGYGRPLTLGERKSLARKPDRNLLERLVHDPHPDVIHRLLANPRITEDDVVRLSCKRPARPEVLAEIARTPRWVHRPRVRLALMLNPGTPFELAAPIAALLLRHELKLVAEYTYVSQALRALCLEHWRRRVPLPGEDDSEEPRLH
jgi:hypothetical protein